MKGKGVIESEEAVRRAAGDWFARLRSGPLSAADQAALKAWRSADPVHGETLDRLVLQWDQSRFLARGALAARRDLSAARAWHRRPAGRVAAIAAALVLVFCGLFLLRPASEPVATIAYSAGESSRTVALADGSSLVLTRGSEVRVAYSATLRRIDLAAGRVRFDVAHDPARPFTVFADGGSVRAIGTVFEVERTASHVRVRLLEGTVEVSADALRAPQTAKRLSPGEAVGFARGALMPVEFQPKAATSGAMLSFDDMPLERVVAQFNGHNGPKLAIGSRRIAALRVTGAYIAADPQAFARAAASMFGLELRRDGAGVIRLEEPAREKTIG